MIPGRAKPARHFQCWIEGFCEYSANLPSPKIFRKWGGIAAVAGALERKISCAPYGPPLYPNSYIVLVGGPGVGKTIISGLVEDLWRELPDHHVAPTNVSRASLIDALNDAKRKITCLGEDPPYIEFNALNVAANELGVFIPAWDSDFMNHLTDLWDGRTYQERKRTGAVSLKIDKPLLNMIGCTTPSWLMNTMPEGAWEQGFAARVLFVYSGEHIITELAGLLPNNEVFKPRAESFHHLASDLKRIGELRGEVSFDPEAVEAVMEWHRKGGPPKPDHPKLTHYVSRRTTHLIKLCMIFSAAKRDDLVITLPIYQQALDTLLEFEHVLPDVFKAMVIGGDAQVMNELHYQMLRVYASTREPVTDQYIWNFLRQRLPAHSIERAINAMMSSGVIVRAITKDGKSGYTPRPKSITF